MNLIETLKQEERSLMEKIRNVREKDDMNSYKNLIRCLTDVTRLKQEEMKTAEWTGISDMYIDVGRDESTIVYFKGNIYYIKEKLIGFIADKIITDIIKDNNVNIYIDTRGIGSILSDKLTSKGYEISDIKLYSYK